MTTTNTLNRFGGALGAVIEGVDVNSASEHDVDFVRQALLDHHVVVIPNQDLDQAGQETFMARFGPLHFHPFLELMGVDPVYSQKINQTMDSMAGVDHWHTDLVFAPEPVAFGSLYCRTAPAYGGGTEFANLHLAYEQLDRRWQTMVESIDCQYQLSPHMLDNFAVLAMSKPEGDAVLQMLTAHCIRPNITARWQWSDRDLLIWDERCTLHYGVRDGYPSERNMIRVLVNGDRPFFDGR